MKRIFHITVVDMADDAHSHLQCVKIEEEWGGQRWNCGFVQMFRGSGELLATLIELGERHSEKDETAKSNKTI